MLTDTARHLIKGTFEEPFDKQKFQIFIKNLLNHLEKAPFTYRGSHVFADFRDYIESLERIGKYSDPEGNKLDVLVVHLKKTTSLERARASQRRFVAKYLKGSRGNILKDAALVAFVSPTERDWRFSYVRMEYRIDTTEKGSVRVREEFTPARRCSFLVGADENSHTAQSRLLPILAETHSNPSLADLEEAFSVEKVTREFFENYRALFQDIKTALDKVLKQDKLIRQDFRAKGLYTDDFAKKLLGQIVFLYFLQKKGWFGVARRSPWGSGPKHFIRQLFQGKHGSYNNFFNDILEPLFYNTLAVERTNDYSDRFDCRVPFLNGGLFDPPHDYDWVNTDILLPNALFSNTIKTAHGDTGTGILDVLDRYNFTVKEDEPLEKEVAVDPEMLGKVFENLLEVGDRKAQGTYYTPREIVHHMCRETLIGYLETSFGKVERDDIEFLVRHGDLVVEHDDRVASAGKETNRYSFQTPQAIRDEAANLDQKLSAVKVCDPAVGSGAFLVGMMNEIVRTRLALGPFLPQGNGIEPYELKRHAITKSLYGVDVDPGAVEIAKLRLWLSLIVDEQDYQHIKPLPNLDYKVMQGNSLVDEYDGVKLIATEMVAARREAASNVTRLREERDALEKEYLRLHRADSLSRPKKAKLEKRLRDIGRDLAREEQQGGKDQTQLPGLETRATQKTLGELTELQRRYFTSYHRGDKSRLRSEIESLTWALIRSRLAEQGRPEDLEAIKALRRTNTRPFFLWEIHYADVLIGHGGFDIVIANPPYLKERENKQVFDTVNQSEFGHLYHEGKMDYWYYFLHKATDIARPGGHISYITSRYWLRSQGARKLIRRIGRELNFRSVVDIGKLKVFDNVAGQHMVAVYQKHGQRDSFLYRKLRNDLQDIDGRDETENLEIRILKNSEVITEENEIRFASDPVSWEGCTALGELCDVAQGVVQNPDRVSTKMAKKFSLTAGEGVFVLDEAEIGAIRLTKREKMFVKIFMEEKTIGPYKLQDGKPHYLIYLTRQNCRDIDELPNIKRHLLPFKKIMDERRETKKGTIEWFHLHWPRDPKIFKSQKVVLPSMFASPRAAIVDEEIYFGLGTNVIIGKEPECDMRYVAAVLNSTVARYWFLTHGKRRGAGVDVGVARLRGFPLAMGSKRDRDAVSALVRKILRGSGTEADRAMEAADKAIVQIYGLTKKDLTVT